MSHFAIRTENNLVIGAFYEAPDGRIALTCGWSGESREMRYAFDDDTGVHSLPEAEFQAWTRRADLQDFPNARDPRLPYEFDLAWDVKTHSGLVQLLKDVGRGEQWDEIQEAMERNAIVLSAEEIEEIDALHDLQAIDRAYP